MLRSGLVKKFLNRLRLSPQTSSEAGLTLIECLVAIIIIGLTVSAVTPALIISVASRVQSQKAAQALEVAQAEIDQVRTLVERGGNDYTLARLNASAPFVATAGAITYSTAAQVPVPTDAAVDSTAYYIAKDPTITKKVDQDGDGNADYAAQIFRVAAKATNSTAFTMGVRVYDLAAAENPDSLSDDPTGTARLGMTGSRGERDRLPLASVYASIAREGSDSLCGYIEYLTESPASTAAEFTCD